MKITVVSPHRGDAAFALGLTIGMWLKQGHAVEVVNCFTRSEFAPYSDVQSLHENDRMSFATAVCKREDEAWRRQYGVAKLKLTDLNLKDAPARLHCAREEVFGRATDVTEKVVSKIRRAIEVSRAGALVVPLGLSAHVDHVSARDAALAGTSDAMPRAFYEELPFALHATPDLIKSVVDSIEPTLGTELQQAFTSGTAEMAGDAAVERRRRMALCYDSQLDEQATNEIAAFCRGHGGREGLWSNAAWRSHAELNA